MKLYLRLILLSLFVSCGSQNDHSKNKFETEIIYLNKSTFKGVSIFTDKKTVLNTLGNPDDVRIGKIQETDLNNQTKLYSYDILRYTSSDQFSFSSYENKAILTYVSFTSNSNYLVLNGKTLNNNTKVEDIKAYFPKAYEQKRIQKLDNSVTISLSDNYAKNSIFKMNRIILTFKENKLVNYSYHLASIADLKP